MKIQLTRTKTIEIGFPGKTGGGARAKNDVTGVALCSGEGRGEPAVRIVRKKDGWHLLAAGFVPPPAGKLPACWEELANQPTWELPRAFQAPAAALAVHSPLSAFGQASTEAILKEMAQGFGPPPLSQPARPGLRPLQPKGAAAPGRKPILPPPGAPVSENGRRFAVRPFAEEGFHLSASLPEFQALWLSRLLPEGRRPTAVSLQLAEAALMASPVLQPAFRAARGSLLALLVRPDAIFFAGYANGMPALWRRCPGVRGYDAMYTAVCRALGVGDELIEGVLEDSLVDPRPALEPFLLPVLQQLDLARAYLAGKQALGTGPVLLLGLPHGARHWCHMAEESLKIRLIAPAPFDGLTVGKGVDATAGHHCLSALGAAIAAAEVEP